MRRAGCADVGAVTRDLLAYAVARDVMETVTLVTLYPTPSVNGDGTFTFFKKENAVQARVVALTSNEIERLAAGGITVNKGVSVALTGELVKTPDQVIRADGTLMKVTAFTIEEGTTILTADIPPLGSDGQIYGSGYSV